MTKTVRSLITAAALVVLSAALAAQSVSAPLTNADVVQMAKSGLPPQVIEAKIGASRCSFDTSTAALVSLSNAAVPADIVAAVAASHCDASGAVDSNDPLAPHQSGIYVLEHASSGTTEMVELERAAYQGSHTGGMLASAFTYGIKKVKTKAIIPGPHASMRIVDADATFYFYFDVSSSGLGAVGSISNPDQFAMVRLDAKKEDRETTIASGSSLGFSAGTDKKALIPFTSERVRDGVFRVTPTKMLKPGEYCFIASSGMAGAAGALELYDFGVDAAK